MTYSSFLLLICVIVLETCFFLDFLLGGGGYRIFFNNLDLLTSKCPSHEKESKEGKKKETLVFSVSDPYPDPDWDPDSIRSVDPDSESGSGSMRAKNDPQNRKNLEISCFEELDVLRAERLLL
jgi:hypothetical protein